MNAARRKGTIGLAAAGCALAAVFLIIELRVDRTSERLNAPRLRVAEAGRDVRVCLRSAGAPPWTIDSAEPFVLLGEDDFEWRGKRATIAWEADDFLVGGVRAGSLLRSAEPVSFRLDGRAYEGRLSFVRPGDRARLVLALDLETYVAQVVPAEMPLSYPEAALRAQAIASRTYVLATMRDRTRHQWDVTDDERSQVFGSRDALVERARDVAAATEGIVLHAGGDLFRTYFSANCGGRTRSNAEAFGEEALGTLSGVTCTGCEWSRHHLWTTRIDRSSFRRAAGLDRPLTRAVVARGEGSGYTNRIICHTDGGRRVVTTRRLKRALGRRLKSAWIVGIEVRRDDVVVTGRGFGHGVGLCQQGARGLARDGRDAREILAHYYPGVEFARAVAYDGE